MHDRSHDQGGLPPCGGLPPEGSLPLGGGVCLQGILHLGGGLCIGWGGLHQDTWILRDTVNQAGGTHPTGMLSC